MFDHLPLESQSLPPFQTSQPILRLFRKFALSMIFHLVLFLLLLLHSYSSRWTRLDLFEMASYESITTKTLTTKIWFRNFLRVLLSDRTILSSSTIQRYRRGWLACLRLSMRSCSDSWEFEEMDCEEIRMEYWGTRVMWITVNFLMGRHRTEVAFTLLTQLPLVWFSVFPVFIFDVAEIYWQPCLEQWTVVNNLDQTIQ